MRLVTFRGPDGAGRAGLVDGDGLIDLAAAAAHLNIEGEFTDLGAVVAGDRLNAVRTMQARLAGTQGPWRLSAEGINVLAPFPKPSTIWGVAVNYRDFCVRGGLDLPTAPRLFVKVPTTVIGPGDSILIPALARQVTYEGELGVVIGRRCKGVRAADALHYVAGYVALNDVTANDLLAEDVQLTRGKNIDTFCPLGPYFVTADELRDPGDVPIRVTVNGVVRQDSNTAQLIFGVPQLIEYLAGFATLEPGDLIATGTPAGTAKQHEPPAFLQDGDRVAVDLGVLGRLENPVRRTMAG